MSCYSQAVGLIPRRIGTAGDQAATSFVFNEAVTRFTYNEWGQQTERNWSSWTAVANSGEFTRGFTMHEHLKDLGLIHMNGRVYDPLIGRFLSADPHIQAPGDLQNYNRYSYVNNNPLSFTDPTGFSFKKLFKKIGRFFKKYWRVIVAIAVAVVTAGAFLAAYYGVSLASGIGGLFTGTVMSGSIAAGWTVTAVSGFATIAAGAIGGFMGGLVATGSLKGALFGSLTGAVAGAIGHHFGAVTDDIGRELAEPVRTVYQEV